MPVLFQVPYPLLRYSAGATDVAVVGETVGAALEDLFRIHPALRLRILNDRGHLHPYLILLLGSRELPRDAFADVRVPAGAVLNLVPAVEGGGRRDVRMKGFRDRATVAAALAEALVGLDPSAEDVDVAATGGRVLARDVASAHPVPAFDRSAMDGYALRAEETFGATPFDPIRLRLVGESRPGSRDVPSVKAGTAVRIMTGAPLPPGADAVLMAEEAREDGDAVDVQGSVAPGKHVGRIGEDIAAGAVVLRAGRRLRAQDVGLLASIGCQQMTVWRRPCVAILVTGNELLPPGSSPSAHCIVDSNTPMLVRLAALDGALVTGTHRLADDADAIRELLAGLDVDVLLAAGGSSVGREDFLPLLVAELGALPIHGVAMRPSAPTGIGRIGATRVFLLPGNPVSCLAAYDFFAGPALRRLGGLPEESPYPTRRVTASRRVTSQIGRVDYVRVAFDEDGRVAPLALSGASVLSSTTRADGFCVVPEDSEGFGEGELLTVHLYDERRSYA